MKSKKNALVALSVLIMVFFTLSLLSVSAGAAKKDDKEIKKLEKKVKKNEKEIKGLKKAVSALQTQIAEVNDNISNLQTDLLTANGEIAALESWKSDASRYLSSLQNDVSNLLIRVEQLENTNGNGGFGPPDYDSGWQSIDPGPEGVLVLYHNLGPNQGLGNPDNYVVDMQFDSDMIGFGRHVMTYGGTETDLTEYFGIYWYHLTDARITLYRNKFDASCKKVRIRIWVYEPKT